MVPTFQMQPGRVLVYNQVYKSPKKSNLKSQSFF